MKEQNEQLKNAETKLLDVRKTLKQVQVIIIKILFCIFI